MHENKKKCTKEKEEEENFLIDECLCINAYHSCYYNLIRQESKTMQNKQMKI